MFAETARTLLVAEQVAAHAPYVGVTARASDRGPEGAQDKQRENLRSARPQTQARLIEVERKVASLVLDNAREHDA